MKKTFSSLLLAVTLIVACKKGNSPDSNSSNSSNTANTITNITVSTFAGSGVAGSTNGPGTAASFNSPRGVAVDATGNVYVADTGNSLIRKISPAGVVSTFAGSVVPGNTNGAGTAASFTYPPGIAVDGNGNVYVADGNNLIRKISPAGVVSTLAGSGVTGNTNGTGTAASFHAPSGVAVDAAGNVYVADAGNSLIRKISPAGVVSTLAGSTTYGNTNGTGTAASFNDPTGVAVDAAGNVYVADNGNLLIRKISPAGAVTTFAGGGYYLNGTGTDASFNRPVGLAVDAIGNIYVADSGYIYVAGSYDNLIRKISPAGVASTLAGSSNGGGRTNGTGTVASFFLPQGVAVDASGNVYVADTGNNLIRKITVQ